MKVLMLNGSPHLKGATYLALKEMEQVFIENNIEVELINVGTENVRGCLACGNCYKTGKCIIDDIVNKLALKFEESDGLVVGSPVYYASANATLVAVLDRLFYSTRFSKTMKVGAAIATARRGGITTTFDELNKYFTISGMPVASGQYWNGFHSGSKEQAMDDKEGLQQMRTLARNMTFLLKSIELGKKEFGLPEREKGIYTNFVR